MRLLFFTQAVDQDDPVLGFAHSWIAEFAKHFEHIEVVCLKMGRHELPANVSVHSLGKSTQGVNPRPTSLGLGPALGWEAWASRGKYVARFFTHAWSLRHEYDAVFVHMNQEYVLLGGLLWKMLGKRVYLWRNHYAGSWLTDIAALFCAKLFCTSQHSYTKKFAHTKLMPIGIDTAVFTPAPASAQPNTLLSLGRIAPSKRIEVLLEALGILKKEGIHLQTDIYGDTLPQDEAYAGRLRAQVKELHLDDSVHFHAGVPNRSTPAVYRAHALFYNGSRSGMYDKTIVEAAACGALPIAASADFAQEADAHLSFDGSARSLALTIKNVSTLSDGEKERVRKNLEDFVEGHSLHALGIRLADEIR